MSVGFQITTGTSISFWTSMNAKGTFLWLAVSWIQEHPQQQSMSPLHHVPIIVVPFKNRVGLCIACCVSWLHWIVSSNGVGLAHTFPLKHSERLTQATSQMMELRFTQHRLAPGMMWYFAMLRNS